MTQPEAPDVASTPRSRPAVAAITAAALVVASAIFMVPAVLLDLWGVVVFAQFGWTAGDPTWNDGDLLLLSVVGFGTLLIALFIVLALLRALMRWLRVGSPRWVTLTVLAGLVAALLVGWLVWVGPR